MDDRWHHLRKMAPVLNGLQSDPNARVNYELMSGALIWSDEMPPLQDWEGWEANCMRGVFRYRTTLILGKPEERFRAGWELLQSLCPNWPGFLPDRQRSDPARIQFYQERSAKLLADWEALDERFEKQQAEAAKKPAQAI